jgi:predicted DNA-binding transcriptional regulator YafY
MQRIERLAAINERLRQARPATVSAQTLADDLGVTRRTIERDLASLRAAGLPIYGVAGRLGGTGTIARGGTTMITLTDAELMALVVAAHLARDAPYATAARSAVAKLSNAGDAAQRVALSELRQRFRLATPPDGRIRPRVRSVIEDAVQRQLVVRIRYVDANGTATVRRVEPVGFYLADRTWSLVAWCQLRDAGRMFHLSRITSATLTAETAPRRDVDDTLGWVPVFGNAP